LPSHRSDAAERAEEASDLCVRAIESLPPIDIVKIATRHFNS
jgi:hypothetical protein